MAGRSGRTIEGMRPSLLALALVVGLAVPARAQTFDFATCDPAVTKATTCSSSVNRCCEQATAPASAFLYNGTDKAIVIPMDFCHQAMTTANNANAPTWCANRPSTGNGMMMAYGLVYRLLQAGIPVYWIVNPSKDPVALGSSDNNNEIATDIDMWILDSSVANPPGNTTGLTAGGTPPVKHMTGGFTAATFGIDAAWTYSKKEFPIRGSAFFISANDRANFNKFVNRQSPYTSWANRSGCGNGGFCYDFRSVNMYEVQSTAYIGWIDYTTAGAGGATGFRTGKLPIATRLSYTPPKVAKIPDTGVSQMWLGQSNLQDKSASTCSSTGIFSPSDSVYCEVAESDIQAGTLKTAGFGWLWIDHQTLSCGATMTKVRDFLTAVTNQYTPGNVMAIADGIGNESCANQQLLGKEQGSTGLNASNGNGPSQLILRYPQSLYMQWGDTAPDYASGASGSGWTFYGSGTGYNTLFGTGSDSLHRLVSGDVSTSTSSQCLSHKSSAACDVPGPFVTNAKASTGYVGVANADTVDVTAYGRFENNANNGIVYYLPGTQIHQHTAELRMLMDSILATPTGTVQQVVSTTSEVSRSSPVVASIANHQALVQGSFEVPSIPPAVTTVTTGMDLTSFEFPYQKGHLRAIDDTSVTTTASAFGTGSPLFDAANAMPSVTASGCGSNAFGGSCRTLFTNLSGSGYNLSRTLIDESTADTLAPVFGLSALSGSDRKTFVDRILAGHWSGSAYVPKLGGVDRSTAAVIEASAVAGASRPKMIYVGATDGMLHAFCGSVTGACTTLGRELWAFVPRVNLPRLRLNAARIDGSPRVVDVLGDFTTGNRSGAKSWHTVLIFQTGSGDATTGGATYPTTPAVYALDITDPTNPKILFEYTTPSLTPSASHTFELGAGLTVAEGTVSITGSNRAVAYAVSNNGGTGGSGIVVVPLDLETGATLGWKFGYAYGRRNGGDTSVPTTGLPGGAVGVDKTNSGTLTNVVFGDLYGNLWEIDPATGASNYNDSTGHSLPLFSFSSDYHAIGAKPAIYSDGTQEYAIVVSGGYADPSDTQWGSGVQQYLVAIALSYPTSNTASLTENSSNTYIKQKIAFGSTSEKAFGQALVVGTQVFVTTDTTDINATGYGTGGATGKMYSYSLTGGSSATTVAIAGGASSLANDGTLLYIGSSTGSQRAATATTTVGTSVDDVQQATMARSLWLRTE